MTDERRQTPDRREKPRGTDRRLGMLEQRARVVIQAAIIEQNLSIEAAALLCDLPYGTMWRVLRGYDYRMSTLDRVAIGLRIPPSKFFRAA